jgi:hypothetical protein
MRCAKLVIILFSCLFLAALLIVPVTTTTSRVRQDAGSNIVIRTSYPRNATMFLPRYLSLRSHPDEGRPVHLRLPQWVVTMAIVAVLGVFDYVIFCRLLRRRRPPTEEPEPGGE